MTHSLHITYSSKQQEVRIFATIQQNGLKHTVPLTAAEDMLIIVGHLKSWSDALRNCKLIRIGASLSRSAN
jgi:hypothetical protein